MANYNITTSGNSIEIDDGSVKYRYPKNYFVTPTDIDHLQELLCDLMA